MTIFLFDGAHKEPNFLVDIGIGIGMYVMSSEFVEILLFIQRV